VGIVSQQATDEYVQKLAREGEALARDGPAIGLKKARFEQAIRGFARSALYAEVVEVVGAAVVVVVVRSSRTESRRKRK